MSAGGPGRLRLLGRFDLDGMPNSTLGSAGQRLLCLLAVHAGTLPRWRAAQMLYPQIADSRAGTNLRAVVWRIQRQRPATLLATTNELCLAPTVMVDYWNATSRANRLLGNTDSDIDELTEALGQDLRHDLLPGWPEPWLVHERERFHQLRLHALEALSAKLTSAGWYGAAVDVGLAAVSADPLRESARRAVVDAYLAEGNTCDAVRQFDAFRALLDAELGLRPTDAFRHRLEAALGTAMAGHRDNRLRF